MADLIVAAWQTAYTEFIAMEFPKKFRIDQYKKIFLVNIQTGKEMMFVCESGGKVIGLLSGRVPDSENTTARSEGFMCILIFREGGHEA